jgi:hypothetical protein
MSALIWMEHEGTGNRAELPDLPYWRANGWRPCDGPPPEEDYLRDAGVEPPDAASEPAETNEDPDEPSGSSAVQPKKRAARKAVADEKE